jgi:aspartokinase/homoserine dehydrogenase 1
MFAALAERSISVTMISQSDSEASICVVLPEVDAARAEGAIRAAFRADLAAGLIEDVRVRPHVGIIAAVGLGMAHTTGIAGRLLTSLGDARVNVIAIAQGSSELNISVAIDGSHVDRAIEAVHRTFGLAQKDTGRDAHTGLDLLLLGGGRIARELLTQLRSRQAHIEARFGLVVRLVGVADSSGFLLEPSGLSPERIDGLVQAKASGDPIHTLPGGVRGTAAELVAAAREWRLSRPIVVDVTDANDHDRLFLSAFEAGYDVVTANKKPLAGSEASYRALQAATADGSRLLKAETTVGAGLPVVDTLEMLHATGDRLLGAFGSLSGTLAYLMAELEGGAKLSVAVERAKELGYTEPDPVADLSGVDVARKAIILGRISGLAPHAEVHLEGLVDASLAGCSHEELMATLRTLDPVFERRIAEAAERGAVLRYAARVQKDRIEVGPIEVGRSEPLGQLQGSDNLIVFTSERYSERPLVVSGPGAGVAVTAMGVLGDILRIAAERR